MVPSKMNNNNEVNKINSQQVVDAIQCILPALKCKKVIELTESDVLAVHKWSTMLRKSNKKRNSNNRTSTIIGKKTSEKSIKLSDEQLISKSKYLILLNCYRSPSDDMNMFLKNLENILHYPH
ncbi:hypothetical protein HHI36_013200 [Cryptolaemus montrouzieri]|uniref:Uncharacterized protein n=1 Tax=Cryptolaemus montrouzieri TaxID=559131 RepID=A0ABD2NH46_9CUCU